MTSPVTHSTQTNESDASAAPQKGIWGWLNHRTGLDALLRTALYEPIPGGARFAYVFGSALLFIFISQVITGVFLALYYIPSADHAHTTVAYITKRIVGILVIPTVLVLAVVALPFLDRSVERRPWKRPVAMGAYAFMLFALVGLGLRSQYVDKHDAGVAQQLAKQRSEEEEFMHKPFEPELSSASLAAANVALADPLAAKGKTIFEAQSCNACHGDGGVGTAAAPALVGISAKVPPEKLAQFFQHPTPKMTAGGMPPIDLPADDLKALIAYVEGLK